MKTVTLYTDGACSGNPGPGGWGAILEFNGIEKELSGGEENTTNNTPNEYWNPSEDRCLDRTVDRTCTSDR